MVPSRDILELLFGQVASIVATLTGLIGAFSTFRLQNINSEVNLLKDIVVHKKSKDGSTVMGIIKANDYNLLEKIFDPNIAAVNLLKQIVADHGLDNDSKEIFIDIDNLSRNQQKHDEIKRLTVSSFKKSLLFVFLSLILLIFVDMLVPLGGAIWIVLFIYLCLVGYVLYLFSKQIEKLVR